MRTGISSSSSFFGVTGLCARQFHRKNVNMSAKCTGQSLEHHLELEVIWDQDDNRVIGNHGQHIDCKPVFAVCFDSDPWPALPPVPLLVQEA